MVLESLLELVETLRERIDEHGAALRQNEMRTRYALIDPLLQELGWDTSDPSDVMIEDGSGDGRADYLLLDKDQPVMIIEAKRLSLGVSDGRQQAVNYAMDRGRRARYFAVTDGNQWEIYDTHQPAIDMLVISFALKEDVLAEVCLKAIALWRPAVEHDSVMAATSPIIGLWTTDQVAAEPNSVPSQEPHVQSANDVADSTPQVQSAIVRPPSPITQASRTVTKWIPLSEYRPVSRERPTELMFPDSTTCHVRYMREVLIETTRWLVRTNNLEPYNQAHCPITGTSRHIVSNHPTHPDGESFENPEQVEGLWVNTKYPNPQTVRNTCKVINHVGQDPSQFKVRLST